MDRHCWCFNVQPNNIYIFIFFLFFVEFICSSGLMFPRNHLHLKRHDVTTRKYHKFNNKEHKPAGKLAFCYTELMLLSNHSKKVSAFHHFTEFLLDLLFLAGSRFTLE